MMKDLAIILGVVVMGVLGFLAFVFAAVGLLAFLALLAMAFWSLVFAFLAYLLPDMAETARAAVHLGEYAYWQIGAGVGFILFLLRTALSRTTTS